MRELNYRLHKSACLDTYSFYHQRVLKEDQYLTATLDDEDGVLNITIFEDKTLARIKDLDKALKASEEREQKDLAHIALLLAQLDNIRGCCGKDDALAAVEENKALRLENDRLNALMRDAKDAGAPFTHEESVVIFEAARRAMWDAEVFDWMGDVMDLSDEAMVKIREKLQTFMDEQAGREGKQ